MLSLDGTTVSDMMWPRSVRTCSVLRIIPFASVTLPRVYDGIHIDWSNSAIDVNWSTRVDTAADNKIGSFSPLSGDIAGGALTQPILSINGMPRRPAQTSASASMESPDSSPLIPSHATFNGSNIASSSKTRHVDLILERNSPFAAEDSFTPGQTVKDFLRTSCKILVIGAGGLGCEILANLALLGFSDIHVIDMDTIDVSNLNRQFLFRSKDVGRPKALVAAEFIMCRVPGVRVTPYFGKIQDKDEEYYNQFNIVICGLDSVEARRWMNATLVQMVDPENPETLKPMIDGGTEGFKGQSRVILPGFTSCYECSLDLITPATTFPICTIAQTPRLPEHCIEWASVLEWPKVFKDKKLDNDDPDHIQWLYDQASARAAHFNIEGVTWSLTQGVVKNIIPAIASTNAIIAASCCNEAFKIATSSASYLDNYMMYAGNDSVYTYTFSLEKKAHCPVCGDETQEVSLSGAWTLERLIEYLKTSENFQMKNPSLSLGSKSLYLQAPPQLERVTRPNLEKTLAELNLHDADISVTDARLPFNLNLRITLT
ncbi:uncharacterized protein L969DRAFT_95119 [Mixia osmundae IAM 14324]|uniref:NEDD8-activating enzyme E1 catalytic subunit n=1 Tax=Mixia osmundae (strain CBS 9802 / IAM 14324 / JCM 22182 / KY 12970) TaxID=764103 RepID=G7E743_MIXOS|nr:uncharacterized protein L969DRAFT_95119 [Mixia osmundae IAM 14324]KEI38960.1 hypothetical protein L969DRAFT_95119 [Mixia osmundae IAM 14324]GAA98653.1 hypothetical protein E5Q_05341 [Mixia osmundae IAM 14324]